MKEFIKETFESFSKDYNKQTALKLLEISLKNLNQDQLIKDLETEIIKLKNKIKALEQDKEVYFSQEELELYLRTMYSNIEKKKYSIGMSKLTEKTNLDIEKIKAIRAKLIDDGIIKVSGMKTEILKYLDLSGNEKTMTFEELKKEYKSGNKDKDGLNNYE